MGLFAWVDSKMKTLRWYDMSLTKLSMLAFALFVAKLWPPILGLEWYWYFAIFILAAIIPIGKVFAK